MRTELRQWIDRQYRKAPGLKKRVDALVEAMSVEQDLIALRQERGLSQRELARLAHVKQPVIARIESGRARNLELKTIVRIAVALGARVRIRLEREKAVTATRVSKRKFAKSA
jgi:transcriptional regulator with XRE-family HTH domain